jgi:hypothetical protein
MILARTEVKDTVFGKGITTLGRIRQTAQNARWVKNSLTFESECANRAGVSQNIAERTLSHTRDRS